MYRVRQKNAEFFEKSSFFKFWPTGKFLNKVVLYKNTCTCLELSRLNLGAAGLQGLGTLGPEAKSGNDIFPLIVSAISPRRE
jgi:hypothetical protein